MQKDMKDLRVKGHYNINNQWLPSVTTILGCVTAPALIEWFKRTDFSKQKRVTEEAMDIGTRVHKALELYLRGEDLIQDEVDEYVVNGISALSQFESLEGGIEPISLEETLYTDKYAGTADCIGYVDGKLAVIDIKTSKAIHESYELQLHAYAYAWALMKAGPVRRSIAWHEKFLANLPKVMYIIRLDKVTGELEYRRYDWDMEKYRLFESIIQVYRWLNADLIKSLEEGNDAEVETRG